MVVGYNENAVLNYERYNISNDTWTELGELEDHQYKFGIAMGSKNTIYLIGGKLKVNNKQIIEWKKIGRNQMLQPYYRQLGGWRPETDQRQIILPSCVGWKYCK